LLLPKFSFPQIFIKGDINLSIVDGVKTHNVDDLNNPDIQPSASPFEGGNVYIIEGTIVKNVEKIFSDTTLYINYSETKPKLNSLANHTNEKPKKSVTHKGIPVKVNNDKPVLSVNNFLSVPIQSSSHIYNSTRNDSVCIISSASTVFINNAVLYNTFLFNDYSVYGIIKHECIYRTICFLSKHTTRPPPTSVMYLKSLLTMNNANV
jgi:hypothetical protein